LYTIFACFRVENTTTLYWVLFFFLSEQFPMLFVESLSSAFSFSFMSLNS